MLERFGRCGHSATPSVLPPQRSRQPSVSAHSIKQLAAQPTPRLDRSPWQGFGTATDASASIELGFGESGWQLPDGRGRLSRCAEAPRDFVTRVGTR